MLGHIPQPQSFAIWFLSPVPALPTAFGRLLWLKATACTCTSTAASCPPPFTCIALGLRDFSPTFHSHIGFKLRSHHISTCPSRFLDSI